MCFKQEEKMRIKYRDNMATRELHQLCRELAMLEQAYSRCITMDQKLESLDAIDEMDELRKAALNHRGQP